MTEPAHAWRDRLPLGLSSAAMLLAVLGLTPVGEAAQRTVQRVAFARNAAAVNGVKASRIARPNTLLPLGSDAKFPAAVVPQLPGARGAQGTPGEPGPAGPAGVDGGQAIVVNRKRPMQLPAGATDVLVLKDLPAGAWVLQASVELLSNDTIKATLVRCALLRGETEVGYGQATLGKLRGGARVITLPALAGTKTEAPTDVRVRCEQDGDGEGREIDVPHATMSALRVTAIEEFEGGG